jgi:hypothetical protein
MKCRSFYTKSRLSITRYTFKSALDLKKEDIYEKTNFAGSSNYFTLLDN